MVGGGQKMMKRIFALILSAFMIISITACKKADNTDKPEIGNKQRKMTELKPFNLLPERVIRENMMKIAMIRLSKHLIR